MSFVSSPVATGSIPAPADLVPPGNRSPVAQPNAGDPPPLPSIGRSALRTEPLDIPVLYPGTAEMFDPVERAICSVSTRTVIAEELRKHFRLARVDMLAALRSTRWIGLEGASQEPPSARYDIIHLTNFLPTDLPRRDVCRTGPIPLIRRHLTDRGIAVIQPTFESTALEETFGVAAFSSEVRGERPLIETHYRTLSGDVPRNVYFLRHALTPDLEKKIRRLYPALHLIHTDRIVANWLGVANRRSEIARACVHGGILPPTPPDGNPLIDRMYLDPSIVGKPYASRALRRLVPHLDALRDERIVKLLANLFNLPCRQEAVARYLVDLGIVPKEPTDPHIRRRAQHTDGGRISLYLEPGAVGPEVATAALRRLLLVMFGTLDGITRNESVATRLGCRPTIPELVRACAAPHLMGSTPPWDHPITRPDGRLSVYYDRRYLGETAWQAFAKRLLVEYPTIDSLERNTAVARALQCKNAVPDIVRKALELNLYPQTPPADYPWERPSGQPSRYFVPLVVGAKAARRSVLAVLRPLIPDIDAIATADVQRIAGLLGVHPTQRAIARRCITLGIADGPANPQTTLITRPDGALSLHLDPRVRRRGVALRDLRQIVETQRIPLQSLVKIPALALLLRCEPSVSGIAAALIQNKVVQPDQPITGLTLSAHLHPLLNPELTPIEARKANLRRLLADRFPSLDAVERDHQLAAALGCANTRVAIAKAMVAQGLYSWRAPRGFSLFNVPGGSLYVSPEVMGHDRRVELNIKRGIKEQIHTLDDVRQNEALSSALGCEKSATAIARSLVQRRIMSAVVPLGHPFAIGHTRSNHFDPIVVGPSQLRDNLRRYFQYAAPTLDDLPMSDAMCELLGLDHRRRALAKYVVAEGLIDPRLPPKHQVQRAGGTLYFDHDIIPADTLRANIKQHIDDTYGGNLDLLPVKSKTLASALKVANNKGAIIRALVERGIVSPHPPAGYDPRHAHASVYFHERFVGGAAQVTRKIYDYTLWRDSRQGGPTAAPGHSTDRAEIA